MFVPLYDGVPMRRIKVPFVTFALLAVNIAVFVALSGFPVLQADFAVVTAGFGAIPSVIVGWETLPEGFPFVPAPFTLLTAQFIHVSWVHLLGNLVVLFVFGDNIEDAFGHLRFLAFYLLCGVAGGLMHVAIDPSAIRPLVGASGAISGVIAAYLLLHPRVKVWGLVFLRVPFRLRAAWGIGLWIAFQIGYAILGGDDSVGWYAHFGGFLAGLVLTPLLVRRDQPLFGAGDGPNLTGDVEIS